MKDFFKPSDFLGAVHSGDTYKASNLANEKLNELIESWPVVYKYSDSPNWMPNDKPMSSKDERFFSFDQKARIAFIEEIVKKDCAHEPVDSTAEFMGPAGRSQAFLYQCKHCGVELQATWSEK